MDVHSSTSISNTPKMRRILSASRSIGPLRPNASPSSSFYVCSTCRHRAPSFSTSSLRTAGTPLTDRVRRKIWGDNPPGLEDPYGGQSKFENKSKPKRSHRAKSKPERELPTQSVATTEADYEPASTWDGLERVGGMGNWWRDNWDPKNQFKGFMPPDAVEDTEEMTAALHRAMVEVFSVNQAGLPLVMVSEYTPGLDFTHDVQIIPSAGGAQLQFTKNSSLEQVLQSLTPPADETAGKGALTESEKDVAADRSDEDPLDHEEKQTPVDETAEKGEPTESEEDVAADRSEADPLKHSESVLTYEELIASWDPSWLQVSVQDPEVLFAASSILFL